MDGGAPMTDLWTRIAISPLWVVHEFLHDGKSRFFWLYVVTGLVLSWLVGRLVMKRGGAWRDIFRRENWVSASAINDYLLVFLRPLLALTVLSWAAVNGEWIANTVAGGLRSVGVAGTVNDAGAVALAGLLTVALFVVDDFLKWLAHTAFHRIPALWEFHKVHHSAEHLNFLTSERFHPVEAVMTSALVVVGIGTVNGVFIALAGGKLTPSTVAGANVLLFAVNIFGGVLRHSPFWLSFGPRVERWIISPAQHQIHHSENPRHFDKNMGVSLAVWDRMAGSLCLAEKESVTSYGIGEETRDFRSFSTLLLRPFLASAAIVARGLRLPAGRRTRNAPSMFGAPPRA